LDDVNMNDVRMYKPVSDGTFAGLIDDMRAAGWSCSLSSSGRSATCVLQDVARVKLVSDDDMLRAQLLDGKDSVWPKVESFISSVSGDVLGAHITSGTPYWRREPPAPPLPVPDPDGHSSASLDTEQLGTSDDGRFARVNLSGSIVWVPLSSVSGVGIDPSGGNEGKYDPASAVEGGSLWPDDPDQMHGLMGQSLATGLRAKARVGSDDKSRTFGPYTPDTAQAFLSKVRAYGMSVSGSNPWHIDANQHGITLDASRAGDGTVTVTVLTRNFYVALSKIWDKVVPLMPRSDVSGDDVTRWDDLAAEMKKLDLAIGDELHDAAGKVLGIVGEDWTPPISTDPQAQITFLEKVYERTKDALERSKTMGAAAAKKVEYEARVATVKAQKLAHDVNQKLEIVPTPEIAATWKERGKAVESGLDTLETGAKWYLGAIAGVAVGWWIVVGVGAYLYFGKKKERLAA